MQIELLHYELERRWNMNSNAHRKQMTDLEKDQLLNSAIHNYVEMFYSGTNPRKYQVGFEVNQQRIDMLDTLVVGFPEEPLILPTKLGNDMYSFDLNGLTKPYKSYISGQLATNCGDVVLRIEQHGDIARIGADYHRKSSLKWREFYGVQRNDKLIITVDPAIRFISGLKLTYLKKPAEVCLGTYSAIPTTTNPKPLNTSKVECDLPADYHEIILMIAEQELHRIYHNVEQFSVLSEKINNVT